MALNTTRLTSSNCPHAFTSSFQCVLLDGNDTCRSARHIDIDDEDMKAFEETFRSHHRGDAAEQILLMETRLQEDLNLRVITGRSYTS